MSAPSAADRLPSAARVGLSRTGLEVRQFFRERDAVVFVFAYPVIMMVIFGSVFGGQDVGVPGVGYAQYFVAGIAATGVVLTSFQSLAITIATERDDGTLKRVRGTPMPPVAYVLGKVGLVLVTTVGQLVLLLATAVLLFGVDLPTGVGAWATFAWVVTLGAASGTVLGIAFSSVPRSGRSASAVVSPPVIVLQFFSGVFFAYSQLPGWMQHVAEVFPLKWMAQGLRSVFLPDAAVVVEPAGSWQLGTGALVLVAWTVVGLLLALRTFRWTRRDDG